VNQTMVETVSATLADEMARDERILVFGQDVRTAFTKTISIA